jgi:hypothetical protein
MKPQPCGPRADKYFTFREAQDLLGINIIELTDLIFKHDVEVRPKGISGQDLRKIWNAERCQAQGSV